MNGETRNRIQGALIGAIITFVIFLLTATFGYGHLNGRVDGVVKRINCIEDIRERLARVETKIDVLLEK